MVSAKERLTEIKRSFQKLGEKAPDFLKAFQDLRNETEKAGAVDKKTKKLVAIALSIVARCEWCIAMHTKDALEEGATPEEIMEIVFLATLMGGAPSLMFGQLVMQALEEFSE